MLGTIFSFLIGCLSCFVMRDELALSPIIASALTGLMGSFIPDNRYVKAKDFAPAIYSGSFAGMCSSDILENNVDALILGLFGGVVFYLLRQQFMGIGGKLGTISLLSIGLSLTVMEVLNWLP